MVMGGWRLLSLCYFSGLGRGGRVVGWRLRPRPRVDLETVVDGSRSELAVMRQEQKGLRSVLPPEYRGSKVNGIQRGDRRLKRPRRPGQHQRRNRNQFDPAGILAGLGLRGGKPLSVQFRSEERRVGKEGR